MGYLGRRIGLSQNKGDSTPGSADGAALACDTPILLPRYPITYSPQLISSYATTTLILPAFG